MNTILSAVFPRLEKNFPAGFEILRQGERRGLLYVLAEGSVEIVKNDQQICIVREKGAVFGELSILLHSYQNASVRTLEPCVFHVIEDAERFLEGNPKVAFQLAQMLGRRLALLDSHFADLKTKITLMQAQATGVNFNRENGP